MSRLCVMICRVDDENKPEELTLLSRQDLPASTGNNWRRPGLGSD